MEYKYCENKNFEDFASGSVLMNKSGFTNFPVRLAQEIYCRCLSYLESDNNLCVYDPCGGSGYLLTTLGFMNQNSIKTLVLSDVCKDAVELANKNLALLTNQGMENRIHELEKLYIQYDKDSHLQAINSAKSLKMNFKISSEPTILTYVIDMLTKDALSKMNFKADIVITDIPYGNLVSWKGVSENAVNKFLINLIPVLNSSSIVAIVSDKQQKIKLDEFARLEKQQIGKRKFEILRLK